MREGKTNQTGRCEYAATIRNKDYKVCALGALAMYFFMRWHISNEPFPDFSRNEAWYDIKVFKTNCGDLTEQMDYKTQYNSICKAFEACGVNSAKKTHAGRGCGARHAEIAGASEDQLRRHGRWNVQSMESSYLTGLPRQSIRFVNGFPGAGGQFWLPRDAIHPPDSLLSKVFPEVDVVLPLVENGYDSSMTDEVCTSSGYPRTICGQGFLNLLKQMRVIFIQDSVFLRIDNPHHLIFSNKLFQEPDYIKYEADLLEACRTQISPQQISIRNVVPEIESVIRSLSQKVDTVTSIVNQISNAQQQPIQQQSGYNEDLQFLKRSMHSIDLSFSQLKSACAHFANSDIVNDIDIDMADISDDHLAHAAVTETSNHQTTASPPNYKMQRWVKSVPDLWHEFTVGFKVGNVQYESIEELDRRFNGSWRSETGTYMHHESHLKEIF
jgi:hypothetical protein